MCSGKQTHLTFYWPYFIESSAIRSVSLFQNIFPENLFFERIKDAGYLPSQFSRFLWIRGQQVFLESIHPGVALNLSIFLGIEGIPEFLRRLGGNLFF